MKTNSRIKQREMVAAQIGTKGPSRQRAGIVTDSLTSRKEKEKRDVIRSLYRNGFSVEEIAQRVEASPHYISLLIKESGAANGSKSF